MAIPLPLIFGAAALLVLGRKKKRRKTRAPGEEPGDAPGEGWGEGEEHEPPRPPPPRPRPDMMGGGFITARPSTALPPIIGWNDAVEQKARKLMTAHWDASDHVLRGGKFFVLMRNTAMEMWPHVKWPLTVTDEMRTVEPRPGYQVPAWIFNLGNEGPKVQNIWYRLRDLAWNITGYKPPV